MKADGKVATRGQVEIANIVAAWYRGEIFPRSAAPTMTKIFDVPAWEPPPEPPAPAPLEIAGGVAGLQKLLVKMAEQNRGLDHAALKELFDTHQVVTAVWEVEGELSSPPGPGFLTLKGAEYLIDQVKHDGRKIRATMTAVWCNSREHAEILKQAFIGSGPPRVLLRKGGEMDLQPRSSLARADHIPHGRGWEA
jgi:hypothetical protein